MKTRFIYLFILFCLLFTFACKNTPAGTDLAADDEGAGGCENEKAKAVLWIDYNREKIPLPNGAAVKTVKVYAHVYADGTVKILSFCKKQPMRVEDYILKRIKWYRIRKEIFEDKYLKAGEQYLQLRYVPSWIK